MDEAFVGEIFLIPYSYAPVGFAFCDGRLLNIGDYEALFSLIGTMYGGDGVRTFALPDLRGRVPLGVSNSYAAGQAGGNAVTQLMSANIRNHTHSIAPNAEIRMKTGTVADTPSPVNAYPAPAAGTPRYSSEADEKMVARPVNELTSPSGAPLYSEPNSTANLPVNNMMPYLCMNFVIALEGIYPGNALIKEFQYISDIIMVSFIDRIPRGYALCNGAELPINQNAALYSLLGNNYGGDGVQKFKLPDLRGSVPIGAGAGPGLTRRTLSETGGVTTVTLTADNLPPHTHTVREDRLRLPAGSTNNTHNPTGAYAGTSAAGNLYSANAGTGVSAPLAATLSVDNGTAASPVNNMQPYLAIQFLIAIEGAYPSRN